MKKQILVALLVLITTASFSQLVIPPVHMVKGARIVPGTKCITSLVNTGTTTTTMYPLVNQPDPYRYISREQYLKTNMPVFTGDSLAFKVQVIKNFGREYKSIYYVNTEIFFNEWTSPAADFDYLYGGKRDMLGCKVSVPVDQCLDYAQNLSYDLMATGIWNEWGLRISSINGHTILEIELLPGQWVAVDVDPGMPGFMFATALRPAGFWSIADIVADTSRILDTHRYYYNINGVDSNLCPWATMSYYRTCFTSMMPQYPPVLTNYVPMDSAIIEIPANARLEVYSYEYTKYMIDSTDAQSVGDLGPTAHFSDSLQSSNPAMVAATKDTIAGILAAFFNVPKDSTMNIFNGTAKLLITDSVHMKPLTYTERQEINENFQHYYLHIPSDHIDTIRVKLPYLVTDIITEESVIAGDTVVSGNTYFDYWDETRVGFGLTSRTAMYANKIIFLPGSGGSIGMVYNHFIYPAYIQGITCDQLGGSGLVMHDSLIYPAYMTGPVTTAITTIENQEECFTVFPNPTTGKFQVAGLKNQSTVPVDVYNLAGSKLASYALQHNNQQFELDFPSGMYFLKIKNQTKRIVLQSR